MILLMILRVFKIVDEACSRVAFLICSFFKWTRNMQRVNFLYVDMNSYFASVEQQLDPGLRGKPVGIVTIAKGNAACIAASYEAKKHFIGVGTRMRDAKKACPGIVFRPARHDVYVDFHHKIIEAVERVYPVEDTHSVDEFSCRLTGIDAELPRAQKLAEEIRASIYAHVGVALHCSIGLGSSLFLAKLAGELKKPRGLDWLNSSVLPQKIAHLELKDLPGVGRSMAKRLVAANINSVTELYAMTPKHARKVWNSVNGERFLLALQGKDVPPVATKSSSLGHSQILSPVNREPKNARLVARRLLIKAATRLRRSGYFASKLYLYVKCAQKGRRSLNWNITFTQDSFYLLGLFNDMWVQLGPRKPVVVSIMLGGFVDRYHCTADLFAPRQQPGAQTQREKLCNQVDMLNQRFGQDTIIYGQKQVEIAPYTGAKIAFGRIPSVEEFRD
jgi:DNA polymerase-4